MWDNHRKIGAQAANVPQEVPVATDRTPVQTRPTQATVLAVTPSFSAMFTTDAPTPKLMKQFAIT